MNKGNSENGRLPKFFKVYLSDESGDDLTLPISFNSFIPNSLPRKVIVKSIYGNVSKLELRKCYGDDDDVEKFVMINGWKKIVKDENLAGGEFLVFEFDGSRLFNFCIYGYTTCKRLRSLVKTKLSDDASDSAAKGVDVEAEGEADDDDDDAEGEANDDDDDDGQYLDDRDNPSFKMTLNPKKKSQLRIPAHVINDYGLNFSENITVVDPLVKKFGKLVNEVKIQTNGCVFIKKFGSVIRRNKVKTTDKMIFELKKNGGNVVHTIKVYIIRK